MEYIGKVIDPLAPLIRPITALIPAPLEQLGVSLLNDECYDLLIRKVDFVSSPECVATGISKGLSWGIVLLSSIVKVPQILNLVKSGSAEGLSLTSFLLETLCYLINIAYNYRSGFPFSTFGETVMIAVQNLFIVILILNFTGRTHLSAAFLPLTASLFATIIQRENDIVPFDQLKLLQSATIPLSLASKVPQVYTIWKNKSPGQLSLFTVVNYLLGSLARVFTTIQEVDDPVILASFLGGTVLNGVLFVLYLVYWKSPSTSKKAKKQ